MRGKGIHIKEILENNKKSTQTNLIKKNKKKSIAIFKN